jgi:hypothetical protein
VSELYLTYAIGTYDHVDREARVKWNDALQVRDLLARQGNFKSLDVRREMLDLTPADNREAVWHLFTNTVESGQAKCLVWGDYLLHYIRDGH